MINPTSSQAPLAPPAPERSEGRRVLLNTSALTGSNLWRILTSFSLQLVIARVLGVESLGIYTASMAYLNVAQVASELGLPTLLVRDLAHAPTQRRSYFVFNLRVQLVASLLIWGGLVVVTWLLPFGRTTQYSLWIIGASLPLYAVTSVCATFFQAAERMEFIMGVEFAINSLVVLLSLGMLWWGGDILWLIGCIVLTQLISAILAMALLLHSRILAGPQEQVNIRLAELRRIVSPFFGLSITDVLLQRLDILLLSLFGGELITGIYSAAYNLVRVLVKLIQTFWKAIYPTLSRLYHQQSSKYQSLTQLGLRFGLLILLPAALFCALIAEDLMYLIYSQGYGEASPVLQALIWLAPLLFLETYAVTVLMVEHRVGQSLAVTALHLLVIVLLLPLLTAHYGALGAAWAVVAAAGAGTVGSLLFIQRLQNRASVPRLGLMLVATAGSTVVAALTPAVWPVRLLVGGVTYLILVWWMGVVASKDYHSLLRALRSNGS